MLKESVADELAVAFPLEAECAEIGRYMRLVERWRGLSHALEQPAESLGRGGIAVRGEQRQECDALRRFDLRVGAGVYFVIEDEALRMIGGNRHAVGYPGSRNWIEVADFKAFPG